MCVALATSAAISFPLARQGTGLDLSPLQVSFNYWKKRRTPYTNVVDPHRVHFLSTCSGVQ